MTLRSRMRGAGPAHLTYDAVAEASAALVIRSYSTSFGLASRLLAEPVRTQVRNVYALVRIADEIVDAPRPDGDAEQQARLLDVLESETLSAMSTGHSANLVVHAFARTARRCGIETELVTPFFQAMRTDLSVDAHDADSFQRYIYGSAEVVGLMCLRVFLTDPATSPAAYPGLAPGAQRLGAAFQKVNFLRDLACDHHDLGRRYFPGLEPGSLSDTDRDALLDDIDRDLLAAAEVIPRLPDSSRRAVCAAHALFSELSRRMRLTPASRIRTERVRVPNPVKARVVAVSLLRGAR